ncbi:MAG: hypothetical protein XD97_0500 [Pelotomaculum thermopropionicum]|uniref:Uncharacterized protein n=1 Tax=Pelotomaculum thermopropionicum TaxID=110500 RepID=A0A117M3D8_9FIRM|nr:MAG: hypothetical protein XD97_0500 [Pelotomaculum thermopropionicum]
MEGYEKPQRLFDCQEPSNYAGLGAAGRSKRGFRALDFESAASASSATSAIYFSVLFILTKKILPVNKGLFYSLREPLPVIKHNNGMQVFFLSFPLIIGKIGFKQMTVRSHENSFLSYNKSRERRF